MIIGSIKEQYTQDITNKGTTHDSMDQFLSIGLVYGLGSSRKSYLEILAGSMSEDTCIAVLSALQKLSTRR